MITEKKLTRYLLYALGEVFLVVIGILIALQVNNWNEARLLKAEELNAITGMIEDIQSDLQVFERRLDALNLKIESLQKIEVFFNGEPITDAQQFVKDLTRGANFGWNQGLANSATYDDLMGSGELGTIRDAKVRYEIANYYRYFNDLNNRMDERETSYPDISYQLVPREIIWDMGWVTDARVDPDLSEEQLKLIADLAMSSPIRHHITAELNLANFIHGVTKALQARAMHLLESLEAYRNII